MANPPLNIYDALPPRKAGPTKDEPVKKSLFDKPISHARGELTGLSRLAGDVTPEVRRQVIDILIDEAVRSHLTARDIAYLLLMVRIESGFNPDAAAKGSSAGGVMQMTGPTAQDALENSKNAHKKDPNAEVIDITSVSGRFNARKNIIAGILLFVRCKAKAIEVLGSKDKAVYEPRIYQYFHKGLYFDRVANEGHKGFHSDASKKDYAALKGFNEEIAPHLDAIESILKTNCKFVAQCSQPDGTPYSGVSYVLVAGTKIKQHVVDRASALWDKATNWSGHSKPPTSAQATDKNAQASGVGRAAGAAQGAQSAAAKVTTAASARVAAPAAAPVAPAHAAVPTSSTVVAQSGVPASVPSGAQALVSQTPPSSPNANVSSDANPSSDTISNDDAAGKSIMFTASDFPSIIKDSSSVKVIYGKTDGDGKTQPIDLDTIGEVYLCLLEDDYDKKVLHLAQQDADGIHTAEANDGPIRNVGGIDTTTSPSGGSGPSHLTTAFYCSRKPDAFQLGLAFEQIGKQYDDRLIEYQRSFIVKPAAAVDHIESLPPPKQDSAPSAPLTTTSTTTSSTAPVLPTKSPAAQSAPAKPAAATPQVAQVTANVKKDDVKPADKPVAKVTTADNNPKQPAITDPNAPWMDIAQAERHTAAVEGRLASTEEGKAALGALKEASEKLKEANKTYKALLSKKPHKKTAKGAPKQALVEQPDADLAKAKADVDTATTQVKKAYENLLAAQRDPKVNNRKVLEYLETTTTIKDYIDNHKQYGDSINWCAAFVNWVMHRAFDGGYKNIARPLDSAVASDWKDYGVPAKEGQFGAIVVLHRGSDDADGAATATGCHVGFLWYEGEVTKRVSQKGEKAKPVAVPVIQLLGGNQTYDVIDANMEKDKPRDRHHRVSVTEFKKSEWTVLARRFPR